MSSANVNDRLIEAELQASVPKGTFEIRKGINKKLLSVLVWIKNYRQFEPDCAIHYVINYAKASLIRKASEDRPVEDPWLQFLSGTFNFWPNDDSSPTLPTSVGWAAPFEGGLFKYSTLTFKVEPFQPTTDFSLLPLIPKFLHGIRPTSCCQ